MLATKRHHIVGLRRKVKAVEHAKVIPAFSGLEISLVLDHSLTIGALDLTTKLRRECFSVCFYTVPADETSAFHAVLLDTSNARAVKRLLAHIAGLHVADFGGFLCLRRYRLCHSDSHTGLLIRIIVVLLCLLLLVRIVGSIVLQMLCRRSRCYK